MSRNSQNAHAVEAGPRPAQKERPAQKGRLAQKERPSARTGAAPPGNPRPAGGSARDPPIPGMPGTPATRGTGTTTSKSIPHRSDRAPAQTERGARPGQIAEPHPDRDGIPLRRSTADRLGGLGSVTEQV